METIDESIEQMCCTPDCYSKALFACIKHGSICNSCTFDFHSSCNIAQILPFTAIEECLEKIKTMINLIDESMILCGITDTDAKVKSDRDKLSKLYKNLNSKANHIKRKKDWSKNNAFYSEILKFKTTIEKSSIVTTIALSEHKERVKLIEKYGKSYQNNEEYIIDQEKKLKLINEFREQQESVEEEICSKSKGALERVNDSINQQSEEIINTLSSCYGKNAENERIIKKKILDTLNSYLQGAGSIGIGTDDSFNSNYCSLKIDCSDSNSLLQLAELNCTSIPSLKQLSIENISSLLDPEGLNYLFRCEFDSIKFLTINTGNVSFYNIDAHIDFMESLLESVTDEVYLYCIQMSISTLVKLITYSHKAKKISLVWSRFLLQQNEEIEFDPAIEFNTSTLNFYWSIYHGDPLHMDLAQFKKLIEALSNTSMIESLRTVECGGHYSYNALVPVDINPIFQEYGFNVQIHERYSQPTTNIE